MKKGRKGFVGYFIGVMQKNLKEIIHLIFGITLGAIIGNIIMIMQMANELHRSLIIPALQSSFSCSAYGTFILIIICFVRRDVQVVICKCEEYIKYAELLGGIIVGSVLGGILLVNNNENASISQANFVIPTILGVITILIFILVRKLKAEKFKQFICKVEKNAIKIIFFSFIMASACLILGLEISVICGLNGDWSLIQYIRFENFILQIFFMAFGEGLLIFYIIYGCFE